MGRIYPKTLHSATTQKIINIQIIVNYLKSYINNIYGEDISQNTIQDNNAKDHWYISENLKSYITNLYGDDISP